MRDVIVTVFGVVGVVVIVWFICSLVFGLSLTAFVTGSMSPAMPAGAAAITQKVAASDLAVGDVVTVARRDGVPVTHRIVEITPHDERADARVLVLRGDANNTDDADHYVVSEAPRVIASLPVAGNALLWLKTPAIAIGMIVVIAGVVVWALWPARRDEVAA